MTVEELPDYLREHCLREQLLAGRYQPQAVKRQLIPKSGGGMRELGTPTVLDRFIQQALLQTLQPRIDRSFSRHSYGFRPAASGRRTGPSNQRWPSRHPTRGASWWTHPLRCEGHLDVLKLIFTRA